MDELITVNNPLAIPPKGRDEHGHLPALPPLLAGTMPSQVRERSRNGDATKRVTN